jgi:hypothetical protein
MKKLLVMIALTLINSATFAQQKTSTENISFLEVKMGHRTQFNTAMETYLSKFRSVKDGIPEVTGYNITGGNHHGEYLIINNSRKSWADRDVVTPSTMENIRREEYWELNIAPHLEGVTADILVYKPEMSNRGVDDKSAEKRVVSEYTVINDSKALTDQLRKMPKVWDKLGRKMVVLMTYTGVFRYYVVRFLPNGWKELDNAITGEEFAIAYDEVYGKGSWDKDRLIFTNGWTNTDQFMMTLNERLTSK